MAKQLCLLSKLPVTPPLNHLIVSLPLCTDSSNENNLFQEQRKEQVHKLQILLQQNRTGIAQNLLKSLLLSKDSPFSSPHELFSLFSISSPSLKPIFSNMMLCCDGEGVMALYEEACGRGVRINIYTCSILLNALCKEGKVEKAEEILETEMENGFVPNEVVFTTIVNGYCQRGDMNRAILTIERMENRGLRPDCITFNSLIDKFCEMREMDEAERWVKKMVDKGVSPNLETHNSLIDGYGWMGLFERCFQILEEMENHGLKPNLVSYGSLINCMCKDGKLLEAEIVVRDMEGRGIFPNAQIYNMLIDGSCIVRSIKDAFRFLDEMVKSKMVPTLVTYNTLINGLCKMGRLIEAEDLLLQITKIGLSPNVITYNSLISGYSKTGNAQKCLELYENMKKLGIEPTLKTYQPLIIGCSEEGIVTVEKLLSEMLETNLAPDLPVYNALMHCYVLHRDLQKILALHSEMVDRGIHPDKARGLIPKADTYNILIKGYCELNYFVGAYIWYRETLENGFLPSFGICNELIAGLKRDGRLEEVQIICSEMSAKGMDDWNITEDKAL
ncbi:hypothetical protein Pint_21886 [Pistacia integerrima]|uniref:Uncharacterized protein n=1 Tax=Pistacia integerrima TaxID=434235 RepID=A0ACC0X7X6_9ROSI|nr:hypothetical protein Pint_21886 [Pistacia integerrima]